MGRYVIRIEKFENNVGDGEPTFVDTISYGEMWWVSGRGDIRVSVVDSNESIVIDSDVRNVEIGMAGATGSAYYWVGDF